MLLFNSGFLRPPGSAASHSAVAAFALPAHSSSTAGRAVYYNVGFGGICRIRGARLVNSADAAGPVTVNYGGYPASRLELANCHLVSLGAAAASIDAAAATNVNLYGESTANKAKHANVTLVGGALTVDALLV